MCRGEGLIGDRLVGEVTLSDDKLSERDEEVLFSPLGPPCCCCCCWGIPCP